MHVWKSAFFCVSLATVALPAGTVDGPIRYIMILIVGVEEEVRKHERYEKDQRVENNNECS